MNINIKYLVEKDLFEMQVVEPQLKAQFLLTRDVLNHLRIGIERSLIDSKKTREKPE